MAKVWIGVILVAILFVVVTIQSELDKGVPVSERPDTKIQTSEIPTETELQESEKAEEPLGDTEKSVSEELQDAVSQILDDTFGFFTKSDLEIVAIGDSLTQGVGDETHSGGYVGILRDTLNEGGQNVEITNYGKRGNRTDQLLKRLEKDEISSSIKEADLILVTIGANDIMKVVKANFSNLEYEQFEKERAEYEDRLRKIFDTMLEKNPDAEIYLAGFYNPFESYFPDVEALTEIIHSWNNTSNQVTQDYEQVHYIPISDLFQPEENRYFAEDNFHPSRQGYRLIAGRVFDYIRPSVEAAEKKEETKEADKEIKEEAHTE